MDNALPIILDGVPWIAGMVVAIVGGWVLTTWRSRAATGAVPHTHRGTDRS